MVLVGLPLGLLFGACNNDSTGPSAGPASPGHSVVAVSRDTLVSGTSAVITLTSRDANDRRVRSGGRAVVFTASGGTSTGTMSAATDHGDGTYSATYVGQGAGTATTIGATIDGAPVTNPLPVIAVIPGPVALTVSFISVTPRTIRPGGTAVFELQSRDAAGNPLTTGGLTVVFTVGGGTATGTVGPTTDHGDGRYSATFTATGLGTELVVGAIINGEPLQVQPPTIAVARGVSADSSTFEASTDTVSVGDGVLLTVRVRDSAGVARTSGGEVIEFQVLAVGVSAQGTVGATTDHDDGTYTATFTATRAGTPVALRAILNGRTVGQDTPSVAVRAAPYSPQKSDVSASSGMVPAGANASVRLVVRDRDSNPVGAGGLAVRFTAEDGTSSGDFSPITDHGDGTYSAVFTGHHAGTPVAIGAIINDSSVIQMLDTLGVSHLPTIQVVPGDAAPDSSLLHIAPGTITPGDSAQLTLAARDAFSNGVGSGGHAVAFARSGGAGVSVGRIGPVSDHGDGTYTAWYRADSAGIRDTIRASIDGAPVTSSVLTVLVSCVPGPASPSLSDVTVNEVTGGQSPKKQVALPSGVSTTVSLRVRDDRTCPVLASHAVTFIASGGGSTVAIGGVTEQGDGSYTATLTGQLAGAPVSISATIDGQPLTSPPALVTVIPGDISALTSSSTVSRAEVDSGGRSVVTLQARDAAGNDLLSGGRTISFVVTGVGPHGSIGPVTDQGNGRYSASYTGTRADPGVPDQIETRIEGTPVETALPEVLVVAGTIAASHSELTVSAATVAVGDSVLVTLAGKDAAGRPLVTGDRPTVVALTATGGTSTGSFSAVRNNGDGTYEAWFRATGTGTPLTLGATLDGASLGTPLPGLAVGP